MTLSELNPEKARETIASVLMQESRAIESIASNLPDDCVPAVDLLFRCKGRVIVTGMGKMSAIARKTAATLSSVGTPSVFLHPSEALHGDLGIVTENDVLLALSNSGETRDMLDIIPFMKRQNVPVISITGNSENALASASQINLATGVTREADQITDAPTTSTTATLALCDSLAIALVYAKGFTAEQFAINHPGGKLGRKLLLAVSDVMVTDETLPIIKADARLRDAIVTISQGKLGAGFVASGDGTLLGIVTDGDLRRVLQHADNPLNQPVAKLMTESPKTIPADTLAVEALTMMNNHSITVLPVTTDGKIVGAVHLHDLLKAGIA